VPVDSGEGTDHEIRTPKQGYLVGSTIDSTLPQGHAPPSDVPDPPTEKLRAHVIGFRLSVARPTLLCRYTNLLIYFERRAASWRRPPGRSRPPGVPRSLLQARGRRRRPGGRPCSLLGPSLRHGRTSNQEGSPCRNDRTTNVACPSSFGGGLPSLCSSHMRGRSYRPAEVTSRHHGFCVRPSRAGRSRKPASSVKSWAHGNMLPMWLLPPSGSSASMLW